MAMIVFAHVIDLAYTQKGGEPNLGTSLTVVFYFTVPLFFMVSGLLLRRSYESKAKPVPYSELLRKKFDTLILPFLVWNAIYMILFRISAGMPILSWSTLWFMSTGYMHLYFVFVLLQFFLLYPLLHPYLKGRGLSLALVLAALSSLAFYAGSEYLLWTRGADSHFFEWCWGKCSAAWALFFFWGVWLGQKPQLIERLSRHAGKLGLVSLALLIVYVWEMNLEYEIFVEESRKYFLLSGLVFQFACANFTMGAMHRLDKSSVKNAVIDYAVSTGKDTFGIYLSHIAVLTGLVIGWEALGLPGVLWPKLLVMPALAWIICDGLVRLCRLRGLGIFNRFLFGGRGTMGTSICKSVGRIIY
jgi:surface polysaccharide O-acyltransferase-like enzyme